LFDKLGKYVNKQRAGEMVYLSSQISTPAVGLLTNFIAAKFLVPYELGVVQTVMLIAGYCSFFHFGVFNGLNRNIAFYEAQGNYPKIQKMVESSWTTALINLGLGLLISIIVFAYYYVQDNDRLYMSATAVVLGMLIFGPLGTHCETIYRSCRSFMALGLILNIKNGINLLLGFLPVFMGVLGLILRYALIPVVHFVLLYRQCPLKPKNSGRFDETSELARVGFPMLVTGILYIFFTAADRTVAALTLGPTAVGELALSGMIMNAVQVIPVSMGSLLYPRASFIYGKTMRSGGLKKFFWFSLLFNIVTIVPICIGCYYFIAPLTNRFLPNYAAGIDSAQIYALGSMFLIYYGVSIIIPVVRRNIPVMGAYLIAIMVIWGLGFLFVKKGYGIEGIAWARFIATGFLCLFTISYSYYLTTADIKA